MILALEDGTDKQAGTQSHNIGDIVRVARVNKAKISYFFTERIADVKDFFTMGEMELRITMGKKWENYVVVHKTPLLKQFA